MEEWVLKGDLIYETFMTRLKGDEEHFDLMSVRR